MLKEEQMKKQIKYITAYEAGQRDALAGIYDKWYRHHGKEGEYDRGWNEKKREDLDYKIIEG